MFPAANLYFPSFFAGARAWAWGPGSGQGLRNLRCPYHGWMYDLRGALQGVPSHKGFGELDREGLALTPVQVDTWGPMGLGNLAVMGSVKALTLGMFVWLYEFRLFEIPTNTWWAWGLLLVSEDFCYYWFHRFGHVVRFFWAAHVNHHSSHHYNLSTALRQSWTEHLFAALFYVPMALLGFPVEVFLVVHAFERF